MPKQNRVTPTGKLVSTSRRGDFMGNRGCLHNRQQQIRRPYQLKRWIICLLEFKDRKRPIMQPGCYTELFFLDEAVALAAGHRPCAECQRPAFQAFRLLWTQANPDLTNNLLPSAVVLDGLLHLERQTLDGQQATYPASLDQLPDGCFVRLAGSETPYLVSANRLVAFQPEYSYGSPISRPPATTVQVLTPRSVVKTLVQGYRPRLHRSALES